MAFSINEFKSQLVGGGARGALFQVQITNPILGAADFKIPFMVKAAAIPESTTGNIQVPYFGRMVKLNISSIFNTIQFTILHDKQKLLIVMIYFSLSAIFFDCANAIHYETEMNLYDNE